MGNKAVYIISVILIVLSGCFGKGERAKKPEQLIPQQKMKDIIYDLYIADGLLNNPRVWNDFRDKDSIESYIDIIEAHGYSKKLFDENIDYYFLQKPKKFEAIYDNVLADLARIEADIIQQRESSSRTNRNIWNGRTSYNLPDDGTDNPVEFSIPIDDAGEYSITARIIVYDDDQSIEPRTEIWFWKDDGTEEGIRDYWETYYHEKSSRSVSLNMKKVLTDTTFTHLQGRLLDHSPKPGHWEKHSMVSNIVVVRRTLFNIVE